jgi:hypothetical protein
LVFAAPAAVLVLALWVGEAGVGRYKPAIMGFSLLWITGFAAIAAGFTAIELLPGKKLTTRMPAGAVDSLYPAEARELAGVEEFFRTHRQTGDQVLCLTYLPIFYYLLDVENPTPYDVLVNPVNTPEQHAEVQKILETNRTRWILLDQRSLAGLLIGRYLQNNYRIRMYIGNLTVLERQPVAGPPG